MNVRCELTGLGGQTLVLTRCIRFSLLRERYQAFAQLHAQFLLEEPLEMPSEVRFFIGETLVHEGSAAEAACFCEKGQWIIKLRSRSFTAALLKNQLVPGIHDRVTLQSLMETYRLPHITYDSGDGEINYIFVKDNAAMWDSVITYNYKLCGGFPYIRVPNLLCMLPQRGETPVVLPEDAVLYRGTGSYSGEMISKIEMADASGHYGAFMRTNPEAVSRGIVRVRQIRLDSQFLYAPDDALKFRIDLSNRKLYSEEVRYLGYCGEDLEDLVQYGSRTARVSRILVTGNEHGITTADTFYFDPFCNVQ